MSVIGERHKIDVTVTSKDCSTGSTIMQRKQEYVRMIKRAIDQDGIYKAAWSPAYCLALGGSEFRLVAYIDAWFLACNHDQEVEIIIKRLSDILSYADGKKIYTFMTHSCTWKYLCENWTKYYGSKYEFVHDWLFIHKLDGIGYLFPKFDETAGFSFLNAYLKNAKNDASYNARIYQYLHDFSRNKTLKNI